MGGDPPDGDEQEVDDLGFGALWTRTVGDLRPVVVDDGVLLLAGPGRLALVECDTGFELWEMEVPGDRPSLIRIDGDEIHYLVGYRHLVIDLDLGEVVGERVLDTHAGERPDATPVRPRTAYDDRFELQVGRFELVVGHDGIDVGSISGPPFSARIHLARRHDHAPPLPDPDLARAYAVLADGSLWCFTADGSGTAVEPGERSRATALVSLVDALHVRGTDPLGLRARLAPIPAPTAADAVLDWAVGSAARLGLHAAGFDGEAIELGDIGSLAGWDLGPEEVSAIGEVLSIPWEGDLDRRAGEEAGVLWTLVASALVGADAVESRAVLLVERSRVLASHPVELPLDEVGGAFPYLVAGTEDMEPSPRREIERVALGLLAAACLARCADLAPDRDDLLNEVRAAGSAVVVGLAGG